MKNEKLEIIESNEFQNLFDKSKKLIDSARSNMGQMANAITVLTSFLLGRYIIEQEQQGSERAKYGAKVLDSLSSYLTEEYGRGFSRSNVAGMRQFYMAYKDREDEIIQSGIGQFEQAFGIVQSGIGQLETAYKKMPFKLSWTHYQILMRIEDKDERDFYEKEAIRSNWNVSTLKSSIVNKGTKGRKTTQHPFFTFIDVNRNVPFYIFKITSVIILGVVNFQ